MKKIISRTKYKQKIKHLGSKLRLIRTQNDLSQGQMLKIINPLQSKDNRARISQLERNQRLPSLVEILKYARFARMPVEVLLDDQIELDISNYHWLREKGSAKKLPAGKTQSARI